MRFHTMGDRKNPAVLFFHAMGVTGESSDALAEEMKEKYFLLMPTLSAYCKGQVMVSKADEIRQVKEWLGELGVKELELLVASSLGADFAMEFLTKSQIPVKKVFMDGGQFAQISSGTRKIMVPFLYLAIKSLYWTKGGSLKKILWCDDERIKPYFIEAGEGLDYTSMRHMMRDCLTEEAFPSVDPDFQENMVLEFGSVEDHFKYREAVMQAYPKAHFPIFQDMNHMQVQIRHPKVMAKLLMDMMEKEGQVLTTRTYTETELKELTLKKATA